MKLGVFDSGIGGAAVATYLKSIFPHAEIIAVNDQLHVPYGSKTPSEVLTLTIAAIQPLLNSRCDVIILACNTATTHTITHLRTAYPDQQFIGIEPMLKPAANLTKTGTIAVCATPATLASERYHSLKRLHTSKIKVIEPDCSQWAYLIENNQINHEHIRSVIDNACEQGADVIVLGCTHYHWIKDIVTTCTLGRATVLEPSEAIARRITSLLAKAV